MRTPDSDLCWTHRTRRCSSFVHGRCEVASQSATTADLRCTISDHAARANAAPASRSRPSSGRSDASPTRPLHGSFAFGHAALKACSASDVSRTWDGVASGALESAALGHDPLGPRNGPSVNRLEFVQPNGASIPQFQVLRPAAAVNVHDDASNLLGRTVIHSNRELALPAQRGELEQSVVRRTRDGDIGTRHTGPGKPWDRRHSRVRREQGRTRATKVAARAGPRGRSRAGARRPRLARPRDCCRSMPSRGCQSMRLPYADGFRDVGAGRLTPEQALVVSARGLALGS